MAVMIAEMLLSLFAVFGLYAAVLLFALRSTQRGILIAVELSAPLSAVEAKNRLAVVRRQLLWEKYPVIVLVDESLLSDAEIVALLEASVTTYYVIQS